MAGLGLAIGIRLSHFPSGTVTPVTITAPTLTRTSSAGAAPLTFDTTLNASDTYAGDYLRVQVDGNSDFSSPEQDILHHMSGSEITDGDIDLTADGFTTPTGLYYLRARVERDDGTVSGWCPTPLTDTIVSSVAVLSPTNGVHKSQYITLDTPLQFHGADWGALHGVEASIMGAAKGQFEFTINTFGDDIYVGMGVGSNGSNYTLATFDGLPGVKNNYGFGIQFYRDDPGTGLATLYTYNTFSQIDLGSSPQVGDVYTIRYDRTGGGTTGTVEVWRTRSGTTVQIGSTITGIDVTFLQYAYGAAKNGSTQGTFNFGASAFAKALANGYAFYG
jgi:TM2 domain-containing membrane protein YozV